LHTVTSPRTVISSGTEGGRRPTGVPDEARTPPDPEVVARTTRRRMTNSYKSKVANHVDSLRAEGGGAIGAYLRKEGLYYSMVHKWSLLRDQGLLMNHGKSAARSKDRDTLLSENKQLRRKLEQTEKRLHKTELLVELQKKISVMMDLVNQNDSVRSAAL